MLAKKHLPAAALPTQMVHVINVANQAGLFKTNYVAIFKRFHDEAL